MIVIRTANWFTKVLERNFGFSRALCGGFAGLYEFVSLVNKLLINKNEVVEKLNIIILIKKIKKKTKE